MDDPRSTIKEVSEEIDGLMTELKEAEDRLVAIQSALPEFVNAANEIAESASPDKLRKTMSELRVLQVMLLRLGLGTAKNQSDAGTVRDALDEFERLVAEGQTTELDGESRARLSRTKLAMRQTERKLDYFRDVETETNNLIRRTEEIISDARTEMEDANREAFRRRVEKYGAIISAFVAAFAGVSIALELLRVAHVIG